MTSINDNDLKYARRFVWLVLAAIAGFLAAAFFVATIGTPATTPLLGSSFAMSTGNAIWQGPAKDLDELVGWADVVVVAKVTREIQRLSHWDYRDGVLQLRDKDDPQALRSIDYEIQVEQVLKGNGLVAEGGTFVWRTDDMSYYKPAPYVNPNIGDRQLMFVHRNVDGSYRSTHGGFSTMNVDGPAILFSDAKRTPIVIPGMSKVPPDVFIERVRAAIARE